MLSKYNPYNNILVPRLGSYVLLLLTGLLQQHGEVQGGLVHGTVGSAHDVPVIDHPPRPTAQSSCLFNMLAGLDVLVTWVVVRVISKAVQMKATEYLKVRSALSPTGCHI